MPIEGQEKGERRIEMTKEQWLLYKRFCEFAKLQDNSGAEKPNAISSMQMYIEGAEIEGWDPLDDLSIVSPEFLTYIVIKAREYWKKELKPKPFHPDHLKRMGIAIEEGKGV